MNQRLCVAPLIAALTVTGLLLPSITPAAAQATSSPDAPASASDEPSESPTAEVSSTPDNSPSASSSKGVSAALETDSTVPAASASNHGDITARGDDARGRRTPISVLSTVAGNPLVGARLSVTTLGGKPLALDQKKARTNRGGVVQGELKGNHTAFVAHLDGGKFKLGKKQTAHRGRLSGLGVSNEMGTYVGPETTIAYKHLKLKKSTPTVSTKKTLKFMRLLEEKQILSLGYHASTRNKGWDPSRFYRTAVKNGGVEQYTSQLATRVGRKGQQINMRPKSGNGGGQKANKPSRGRSAIVKDAPAPKPSVAAFLGGLVTESVRSWITGGLGNVISAVVCAAVGAANNAALTWIAGIFAGCGAPDDSSEKIQQGLSDIKSSLSDLATNVNAIRDLLTQADLNAAWSKAQIDTIQSKLEKADTDLTVLSTVKTAKPVGKSPGDSDHALCVAAYGAGPNAQSNLNHCDNLAAFYQFFFKGDTNPVGSLMNGIVGSSAPTDDIAMFKLQKAAAGAGKFIGGVRQNQVNQMYGQLVQLGQHAALTSAAWLRFREAWTAQQPNSCPLPSGFVSHELADGTSCEVATTAWYQLSVANQVAQHGPNYTFDENVLISPGSGYNWWPYAFDATGYTLRKDAPMEPFFDMPNGWDKGDLPDNLARAVYTTILGTPTTLKKNVTQKFVAAQGGNMDTLISDLSDTTGTGLADKLKTAGFQGPAQTVRGMKWTKLGNWNLPFQGGFYPYTYPASYDDDDYHYWTNGYLSPLKGQSGDERWNGPCDTRRIAMEVSQDLDQYLWPYLDGVFECNIDGYRAVFNLFRNNAYGSIIGAWPDLYDGNNACPRNMSLALPTTDLDNGKPACTADTFGIMVDPTVSVWKRNNFPGQPAVSASQPLAAVVALGVAQINPAKVTQSVMPAIVSGSQNYATESGQPYLRCAKAADMKSQTDTKQLSPAVGTATKAVTLTTTGKSGQFCQAMVRNSGGDAVSATVKIP